jgi:hypothetical protein
MMLSTYFLALLAALCSALAMPATANTTSIARDHPQQVLNLNQTFRAPTEKDKLKYHSEGLPKCYVSRPLTAPLSDLAALCSSRRTGVTDC